MLRGQVLQSNALAVELLDEKQELSRNLADILLRQLTVESCRELVQILVSFCDRQTDLLGDVKRVTWQAVLAQVCAVVEVATHEAVMVR